MHTESPAQKTHLHFVHGGEETVSANARPGVGDRIARLRRERGVTQIDLAKKLGVPQSTVSRYERGRLRLPSESLGKIAQMLGVPVDDILGTRPLQSEESSTERRILKRVRAVARLPRRDQRALLRTIDVFLLTKVG